jgi:hypothetical protein
MNFLKRIFFKPFFLGHQEKEKTIVTGGQTLSFLLPEAFRNDFEVRKLQEQKTEWKLIAKEKKDRIPEPLQKEKRNDIVLNGYEREVEVVSFPPCRKAALYLFLSEKMEEKGRRRKLFQSV